eukprot:677858-Hanusia_phi.AAC.3
MIAYHERFGLPPLHESRLSQRVRTLRMQLEEEVKQLRERVRPAASALLSDCSPPALRYDVGV